MSQITSTSRIGQKWLALGLPPSVLESYPDCANFLVSSGIVYPLVGYANSTQDPEAQGMRIEKGIPLLKMEGCWKTWEEVNRSLAQDPIDRNRILSRSRPWEVWSYTSAGFIPQDQPDAAEALHQREPAHRAQLGMIAQHVAQPIERNAAREMVHVVHTNIGREPAQERG